MKKEKEKEIDITNKLIELKNMYETTQNLFLNKLAEIDKQLQTLREIKSMLSDQYENVSITYEEERNKLLTEQSKYLLQL